MMMLQDLFEGCKTHRGVLYNFENYKKTVSQQVQPFDWDKHLSGELVQGLSPVDTLTGKVKWITLDVDLAIKPEVFCKKIFEKLGSQYFCFQTMGLKWRIVEFLDDWIDVNVARDKVKELEKRLKQTCGYNADSGHSLPNSYNLEEGKAGGWIFLPYHNEDTKCYSPGGRKLTKEQTEFRARYRNIPLIVACVGATGQSNTNKKDRQGSRGVALFHVALLNRHMNTNVDLNELNDNYGKPYDDPSSTIRNALKTCENYDKEHLLNNLSSYTEEICGAKPILDAKGFDAITDEMSETYIYVRDRKDFFELKTSKFVDKEQINDWWKHYTKKQMMSQILLSDEGFKKLQSYFTHAGLNPGVVTITKGDIKGLEPGEYLNIYKPSGVLAKQGDTKGFNEYYSWLFGDDNWLIIKQCLSFMLNSKKEIKHNGIKIQWFIILHSKAQGVGKGLLALVLQSLFGNFNVKINVRFKQLVSTHSTIIEGAQIIVLNEVVLTNSVGDKKELSEEFKNLITEPNLMINPKNKPEVEVPNLCNFFVFSNSKAPLYIDDEDRRAFVINIKWTKEEAQKKLSTFKQYILNTIKDPSAFKWHLENEINYDREMFFNDAPFNEDKEELIKNNRDDFQDLMDSCLDNIRFPFANQMSKEGVHYVYKGLMNAHDLFEALKSSQKFSKTYFKLSNVEDYLKEKCTLWDEGNSKSTTKQIITSRGKIRAYLIHNWSQHGKNLIDMTEGELGKLYEMEPGKGDINKMVQELPNYEEPTFKKDKESYSNYCWHCKTKDEAGKMKATLIDSTECEQCSQCNYAYLCSNCGVCECERPNSKIREAQEKFQKAWDNRKNSH